MKRYTNKEIGDLWKKFSSEKSLAWKCRILSGAIGVPVLITSESWSGNKMEIRLEESDYGQSAVFDCKHFRLAISDEVMFKKLVYTLGKLPHEVVKAVDGAFLDERADGILSLMKPASQDAADKILYRWKKYIDWVEKHYPNQDDSIFWETEKLPKNMLAWGARAILGGVKPSRIAVRAISKGIAEIDSSGVVKYTEDSKLFSVYDFSATENGRGRYESFGWSSAMSLSLHKAVEAAFGGKDADDVFTVNKIPEQWEIDAGYYTGIKKKRD